jgi:hypothetical protein
MKNILLLVALISFGASSQSFKKDYSINAVYSLIDSVKNHRSYILAIDSTNMNNHGVNFNLSADGVFVQLQFDRYDKVFNLRRISGTYSSLFPVWKNLFDKTADKEKIEEAGYALSFANGAKRAHFHLMTDKKTWWITQR